MKSKLEVIEQKNQIGILKKNSSELKLKVDMVEKMCRFNLRELNREHKQEIDTMAGNMKEKSIVSALEVQTISAKNVKLKDTIKELKSVAS